MKSALHFLAAVSLAMGCVTLPAAPATAHTELESADPPAGDVLTQVPARIVLRFDDAMAEQFSTVVATVGTDPARRLETTTKGRVISAEVPSELRTSSAAEPAGTTPWRVAYRVVSADGHPVNGTIDFRVKRELPQDTPTDQATPPDPPRAAAESTASTSPDPDKGSPVVPPVVLVGGLAVALLAVASGLVARFRRRDAGE